MLKTLVSFLIVILFCSSSFAERIDLDVPEDRPDITRATVSVMSDKPEKSMLYYTISLQYRGASSWVEVDSFSSLISGAKYTSMVSDFLVGGKTIEWFVLEIFSSLPGNSGPISLDGGKPVLVFDVAKVRPDAERLVVVGIEESSEDKHIEIVSELRYFSGGSWVIHRTQKAVIRDETPLDGGPQKTDYTDFKARMKVGGKTPDRHALDEMNKVFLGNIMP
jgi:hypothetical protein